MPDDDFSSAADTESGEDAAHIIYYDYELDDVHDEAGWVEASGLDDPDAAWEHLYDRPPTWIERLWWRGRWLVNGVAFGLPLVLLVALFALGELTDSSGDTSTPVLTAATNVTPSPEPGESVTGAWPAGVTFARHTVPAMIRDSLAGGERKGYQFAGRGGFLWTITVAPAPGSAFDPQITLYGPSGEVVASNDNRVPGDPTASLALRLDEDGPYRLVVEAAGGAASGSYVLSVFVE